MDKLNVQLMLIEGVYNYYQNRLFDEYCAYELTNDLHSNNNEFSFNVIEFSVDENEHCNIEIEVDDQIFEMSFSLKR